MIDPELQSAKPQRKQNKKLPAPKPEIRIWRTQPKVDLIESAIGQLVDREPKWAEVAMAVAREARLERLVKVLESFKETAEKRQKEMFENER
jgi:hypothetical protein